MTRSVRSLGLGLVLAVGTVGLAAAQGGGGARYDGQYVGTLILNKTMRGDCDEPPPGAQYPLRVSGGAVKFNYLPRFSTTLAGTVDATGNFVATAAIKSGTVQMTGRIVGRKVTAEVQSPSCSYSFRTE
ncbi:MAG TPA: hypothetical protein VGG57_10120 [Stellaceae bacterium]|jgi:hypothetical protein